MACFYDYHRNCVWFTRSTYNFSFECFKTREYYGGKNLCVHPRRSSHHAPPPLLANRMKYSCDDQQQTELFIVTMPNKAAYSLHGRESSFTKCFVSDVWVFYRSFTMRFLSLCFSFLFCRLVLRILIPSGLPLSLASSHAPDQVDKLFLSLASYFFSSRTRRSFIRSAVASVYPNVCVARGRFSYIPICHEKSTVHRGTQSDYRNCRHYVYRYLLNYLYCNSVHGICKPVGCPTAPYLPRIDARASLGILAYSWYLYFSLFFF